MKKYLLLSLTIIAITASAQQPEKLITEKEVARIVRTLSSDDMMGRFSLKPQSIESSIVFIENEFKKAGLKPFKGLKSFRQEFEKKRIKPGTLDIVLDGEKIDITNAMVVSDMADVEFKTGVPVHYIPFDSTAANQAQYFFSKAFGIIQDTTSSVILIAPELKSFFQQLKGYYSERFIMGFKTSKVLIVGKSSANQVDIKAKQIIETIRLTNILGMLEGNTLRDEMVIFSGHYDHIGIRKPVEGDSIANGADDDASGIAAVIQLANYYKKIKDNHRTLLFVAFTAEEVGGHGAQYFSRQLDPAKVVAMFNIEMIGKLSKWGQNHAFITGFEKSDFGTILQKNMAGKNFKFEPDPYPEQDLFYRSDNATLAQLGVPAHSISTSQVDSDKFYHTVDDEFETLDILNVTNAIRAIAVASKSIVDGKDTPRRIQTNPGQQH